MQLRGDAKDFHFLAVNARCMRLRRRYAEHILLLELWFIRDLATIQGAILVFCSLKGRRVTLVKRFRFIIFRFLNLLCLVRLVLKFKTHILHSKVLNFLLIVFVNH